MVAATVMKLRDPSSVTCLLFASSKVCLKGCNTIPKLPWQPKDFLRYYNTLDILPKNILISKWQILWHLPMLDFPFLSRHWGMPIPCLQVLNHISLVMKRSGVQTSLPAVCFFIIIDRVSLQRLIMAGPCC